MANYNDLFVQYLQNLRNPFVKLCRLRFLNPDGSIAFSLDNNPLREQNFALLAQGNITVNLQNGQRRTASVTLDNVTEAYEYAYGKMWFGQEIALDEGMLLPDGQEFYIQQGVFIIDSPNDKVEPTERTVTYNLLDKWSMLDGTHGGKLEGTYECPVNSLIFDAITALLQEDRGNGQPIDRMTPVYTDYYNSLTQTLPDGTTASLIRSPYTLTVEPSGSKADVILGLVGMINGWVGYDPSGMLRVDPSQDDIADATKPVLWTFGTDETTLLGMTYTTKNAEVYNDVIIVGAMLEDNSQPKARAQNFDPASDTNINLIGRKTYREEQSGFGTVTQCRDLATWKLKRTSILQKSVSISCSQILHLKENDLVEIRRTDKAKSPIERHLIQGFSRSLLGTDQMTITAVSVVDIPDITVTTS